VLLIRESAPRPPALEVAVSHALAERVGSELEGTASDSRGTRVGSKGGRTASHSPGAPVGCELGAPASHSPGAPVGCELGAAASHSPGAPVGAEAESDSVLGSVLRIYRPAPTLAFGRLDALRPGFAAAASAARAHGFEPVVRAPGGHAVAYHEGCLVVDEVLPHADPIAGLQNRFARSADTLAAALRGVGVDTRVGRIAGEFCPGDHTVSARGAIKLVGSAQRVIRHASLLASSIAVTDGAALRAVLEDVYAALELDWDPATAGGVADEVPVGVADVERAVVAAFAHRETLVPGDLDAATLARAAELEPRHAVRALELRH
jgi:octanoyl-[GcvH]:protein N-octanoyltransferase